ncbi:NAD(P)/FAD-dependent oxidoreductase [Micromonospora sp. DT4]|uniref:NAD(P)/FAD-dependent oxidoreductase n=1 Tax=Micromonospora sp. DT4 TaxID=3393438 RepID=UPI003CF4131D
MTDELKSNYDVVVVGGGAAGLNGALVLARVRRSVLVIDAGAPRNATAEGVHGLLAHEGVSPAELLKLGRAEVRRYGGEVVNGEVTTVAAGDGFVVTLGDARSVRARRLLVASGSVDELPNIEGLRERWGRDVLHCPYCHGWEVRDQAIGVLATGPMSVQQALMFRQLSPDVRYFSHTGWNPTEEQAAQLAASDIPVVSGEVTALQVDEDRLVGVRLRDGTLIARDAVTVRTRLLVRAGFLTGLGLRPAQHPSGLGEHIPADAGGRTEIPGVWVAGNLANPAAQVGAAAASGALAAAAINGDLVAEDTHQLIVARQ